ncbi:hypothetical protein [Streptomyces sp. NBC_00654]|uniref:hypothetical protein n=1 Tax=Streptomyces sp. NBC_00654 TaxID=2975799 RepID=UPI00224E56DE|nr:hypothetical protein [Streptomyces sp. NBC_00654]
MTQVRGSQRLSPVMASVAREGARAQGAAGGMADRHPSRHSPAMLALPQVCAVQLLPTIVLSRDGT